jgi:pilus assembly protein Flp/PilA
VLRPARSQHPTLISSGSARRPEFPPAHQGEPMTDPVVQYAKNPVHGRLAILSRRRSSQPRAGRDERGASAVEYGLLIAGIAALIVISVFAFGGGVKSLFTKTCGTLTSATSQSNC